MLMTVNSLVEQLAQELRNRRLTLATAESCTGGLVGAMLTETPGSSAWFLGGVTAYANRIKTDLLGVPPALIETHGAVSPEAARAMAEGARNRLGADFAVSLTGIAGPDGGSPAKPVGLVYIAVASSGGTDVREHRFNGSREDIRAAAADHALAHVLEAVRESR